MNLHLSLILAFATLTPAAALPVSQQQNVSVGLTAVGAPLAIHGYDTVAYFTEGKPMLGSAKHTAKHDGAAYRFASEFNKEMFEKKPTAYLPQFGGYCAFGVTVENKFDGDPRVFAVVDGNIRKASKQWSKIENKMAPSSRGLGRRFTSKPRRARK
jgi:YHS domain-containing protein